MNVWAISCGDSGYKPLVMIRFNPDMYSDEFHVVHQGCFYENNTLNRSEWNHRIHVLTSVIPNQEITTEYLFYSPVCEKRRRNEKEKEKQAVENIE